MRLWRNKEIYPVSRNIKWHKHHGKQCKTLSKVIYFFNKNTKIELPYDGTIPLLGMYLNNGKPGHEERSVCMFSPALSTTAETWKCHVSHR